MANRQGGCLCGAVRYTLSAEPTMTAVCYCTHCQRQSGTMFSTNLVVPEGQYIQQGETKVFQDKGDSGKPVYRHFCATCGSPVISKVAASPGAVFVKAGTLDDASGIAPVVEVYADHAAKWLTPIAGARRIPQAAG